MAQRRPKGGRRETAYTENEYLTEDLTEVEKQRYASRRRRRRRGLIPAPFIFLLLLLAVGAVGARILVEKYAPSTEQKDLNEWFEVEGDTVKLYLNDQMERETYGFAANGEVYLPINWVNDKLNKRFFWNAQEDTGAAAGAGLLVYTLPEETLRFTRDSRLDSGAPVFLLRDDGMYLALSTIAAHTDMRVVNYAGTEQTAKRVFLYQNEGKVQQAQVKRDTKLRTKGGVKAPILTDLPKGTVVTVLEQMEKWDKVAAPGFIGYVQKKRLSEAEEKEIPTGYQEPEVQHNLLPEKVVMAWHLVTGKAANAGFDERVKNTGGVMNVICPTWIQIKDAAGSYDNFSSETYVEKAHEAGLEVWATVDNFNNAVGFREFSTKEYFALSANRADFIQRLMADAETYGYDGFNLDFESLPTDAGPSFAQFYRELSVACRAKGLRLSIDNYVPYEFNSHYDLQEQAVFADYVVIMGYDEHTSGSEEAGSVASIGYTKYGIEQALKQAPAEQVINALPFFTRVWKESGPSLTSDAMGMEQAAEYVKENDIKLSWDEESGQYYGSFEKDSATRKIWMEDARSIGEKMKVIRANKLGGVAAWRLGFEPADIWQELDLNHQTQ